MSPRWRLVPPAAACWASAFWLVAAPEAAWWVAGGAGVVVTLALLAAHRGRRAGLLTAVALVAAAAGLAAACVALAAPRRAVPASPGAGARAVFTIDSAPRPGAGGVRRFHATVTRLHTGRAVHELSAPAFLDCRLPKKAAGEAGVGASLAARVRYRRGDPGDSIALFGRCLDTPRILSGPGPVRAGTDALRAGLARAAEDLPGEGGDLLPGLALGDVARVGPGLDSAMKASSLSHLTAVSGANCAVVVAIVGFVAGFAGLGRRGRALAALAALAGFVLLVTPGPSILRATVMAVIVIASSASGRPVRGTPALAFAVVALLAGDPWVARGYGFVLSVLATGGLLILSGPLSRALSRVLPRRLAALVSIPLAAQLACGPVLVLLSPSLPLYGVPANLLAEPAAPVATILGFLACLLLPFAHGLGAACAWIAWVPSSWIAGVARFTAGLPGHALPWPGGLGGLALLGAATAAALALLFVRRRPLRVVSWLLLLTIAGTYGGALAGIRVAGRIVRPRDWSIAACDVGQADALLLRDGADYALIDTGREPAVLAGCLRDLGVADIDLLVLTHYDADHAGGVEAVRGRVGTALVGRPDRASARRILAGLRRGGARVHLAARGDAGRLGSLRWRVLWPDPRQDRFQTGNEGSVTLLVQGPGFSAAFLGDLDREAQEAILADGPVPPVDIVKVAHHGSADQSTRFYDALHARLGIISVGRHNDYGHPSPRTLAMLADDGTRVVRTDRDGLVLVSVTPSGGVGVWTEHDPRGSAGESKLVAGVEGGPWRRARAQRRRRRRPRSRRWRGARRAPPPSCSCPARSLCSRIVPCVPSGPASRSPTPRSR